MQTTTMSILMTRHRKPQQQHHSPDISLVSEQLLTSRLKPLLDIGYLKESKKDGERNIGTNVVAITPPLRHEMYLSDEGQVCDFHSETCVMNSLKNEIMEIRKHDNKPCNNISSRSIHGEFMVNDAPTPISTNCTIILINFDLCLETCNNSHVGKLFSKLKEQMLVNCKKRNRSFEMRFDLTYSIGEYGVYGKSQNQLHLPHDVKISYNHHCILVADYNNRRIQVFDLYSRQFKATIPTPSKYPMYLCVEENHDGNQNDALIFGSNGDNSVYKFELRPLLCKAYLGQVERDELKKEYIWKTDFDTPQAIAVKYGSQYCRNEIFVCNGTNITILSSIFGYAIDSIQLSNRVYGVGFTNKNDLIVSEALLSHRIVIMRKDQDGKWQTMTTIGDRVGEELGAFNCPYSLIFDRVSHKIIVCDSQNHRIQIFTQDGELVKCWGSTEQHDDQIYHPSGMCLNEMTGELLVCDEGNHRVLIFK
ncbi:hypothetical protein C9374_008303 [Naegleria lovaniensis]|uniref:Uncharacterized protein n=1 Tax=Naegleria lovaniensis TaxID=51637 RepID=A0AA88GJI9_NAELO|nr:uncharacterized protein C9374_008303 [Naegleria lovaniensis]KAG2378664.1 hypothetical protein C9374_008303 [Naegleria lovaniensis]